MDADTTITLGGRKFRPVTQGSIANDCWVMGRVHRAGLHSVPRAENESLEDWAREVLAAVMRSGQMLELLGGLLVPVELEDAGWTEDVARQTATFIGGLTAPEDKATMQGLTLSVLVPFFESGLASSRSSDASSSPGPGEESSATTSGPATTSGSGAR